MTLEEIREMLAAATPGPWRSGFEPYTAGHNITAGSRLVAAIPTSMDSRDCHNGYLIATAPALAALVVRAAEVIQGLTDIGITLDDPRIDYVAAQIDRDALEAARAFLAELGI